MNLSDLEMENGQNSSDENHNPMYDVKLSLPDLEEEIAQLKPRKKNHRRKKNDERNSVLDHLSALGTAELVQMMYKGIDSPEPSQLDMLNINNETEYIVHQEPIGYDASSTIQCSTFRSTFSIHGNLDTDRDKNEENGQENQQVTETENLKYLVESADDPQSVSDAEMESLRLLKDGKRKKKRKKQVSSEESYDGRRRESLRENFMHKYTVDNCSDYSHSVSSDDLDVDDKEGDGNEATLGDYREHSVNNRSLCFSEIVENNSAFFDNKCLYLHPATIEPVKRSSNTIHKEFFDNLDLCNQLVKKYVYIQILQSEIKALFDSQMTLAKLESECLRAEISEELNQYLQYLGEKTYEILIEFKMIGESVSLNVIQNVSIKHKKLPKVLCLTSDILGCYGNSENEQDSESSGMYSDYTETHSSDRNSSRLDLDNSELNYTDSFETERSEQPFPDKNSCNSLNQDIQIPINDIDIVSTIIVICPRGSIPVDAVLTQYFLSMVQRKLATYILALHVGPLQDTNQITLYQYRARTRGRQIHEQDLEDTMSLWSRYEGRLVFPVTPLSSLSKLSIYEYKGFTKEKKKRKNQIKIFLK